MQADPPSARADPETFRFRGIHPRLHLGTTSDRYAGWIGQIYSTERYAGRITRRSRRLGGRTFTEEVLPVESVEEYFEHFDVLEIDYTFYRPLLEEDGRPTTNLHVLREYARHLRPGDRLVLKAPQAFFARKLRRGEAMVPNPEYLDAGGFARRFYEPARSILGDALEGILFEQEYQRKADRVPPERMAEDLDRFLGALPRDDVYHVELRTGAYLCRPVLEVLGARGAGLVFAHWTWLPPLREQLRRARGRFTSRAGWVVIRLLTPRGVRYEQAYAMAHPFDRLVEGMMTPGMVEDAVGIARAAVNAGRDVDLLVNNRAAGNAPLLAREIARRWLGTGKGTVPRRPGS